MRLTSKLLLVFFGLQTLATAQTLQVEIGQTRSPNEAFANADKAVRTLNQNLAKLTQNQRRSLARAGRYFAQQPISFPATVWLTSGGRALAAPTRSPSRAPAPLTLSFDSSGANAFDPTYRTLLQDVFTKAQPFLDALFGAPSIGGTVAVKNYDATMGDRDVVSGGYYVPNAPGTPEIRFPVYGSTQKEVITINFIHCLLLAYVGPNQYGFDAFNEGLVRAVTMRIARTTAFTSQLALDNELIEQVLTNTYEVEGAYDWYNQRALGGATFIAPNLRSVPLPDAGSVGGLYLLRYKMAGSAWTKALVENSGFIATFNNAFYANPGIAGNVPALVALGQTTLNTVKPGDPTIEGLSFAEWFKRQYILETKNTRGPKLLVEPVPITSGLGGSDFGVFILQANWFETTAGGNETLLSGTSYPILWEGNQNFSRVFPNAQDEKMDLAGGYGVVSPNIPNINSGQPYRAAVDVPILDQIERVYLPAGAIATASQQNPRDLYGTVAGANLQAGDTLRLKITVNGSPITDIPVTNNAFGVLLGTPAFLGNAQLVVEVVRTRSGSDTTLLTRKVNKGPGSLALDLRVDSELTFTPLGGLPKGMSLVGFPIDPFASLNSEVLGLADNQVLAARYNSAKAKYELYPDLEPFKGGHGYFIRLDSAQPSFAVSGRVYRNVTATVALKPGWNLISGPLLENIATGNVKVVKVSNSAFNWNESVGVDIGTDFFKFTPGPIDLATGVPETGTLSPATTFEVGQAYFVRVLAPEGVTLAFQPAAGTGLGPTRAASTVMPPSQTGWRMSVDMSYGTKNKASVILGQSTTATRSFDPREDSGMPPGIGGYQVIVEDYEAMYRDVRPLGGGEVYTLHLQGLTPNTMQKLEFKSIFGKAPQLSLRDSKGRSLGIVKPGTVFNYFARSRDEYIQVVVGGTK